MLCWNVYVGDFNSGKFELYNIFNHGGFYNDCVKARKKYKDDREGFEAEVMSSLRYFFWSKSEWEIILEHWPSGEYYEMRKDLKYGQLRDSLGYEAKKRPWIKDDSGVTIRVFPNPCRYEEKKIDVSDQVMNNWEIFIDYLWNNRKELKDR